MSYSSLIDVTAPQAHYFIDQLAYLSDEHCLPYCVEWVFDLRNRNSTFYLRMTGIESKQVDQGDRNHVSAYQVTLNVMLLEFENKKELSCKGQTDRAYE